jgi:hypothetical protein
MAGPARAGSVVFQHFGDCASRDAVAQILQGAWMRLYPHDGFSVAIRRMSDETSFMIP